ncbi:MAG: hypothetical protein ACRDFB_00460, partial [Rhabdochlamydiaceae bacterium]
LTHKNYYLNKNDFNKAIAFINVCQEINVSPLLTNMGIWYYASHFVADKSRLETLLKDKSIFKLENEMRILNGFCEIKRKLIEENTAGSSRIGNSCG